MSYKSNNIQPIIITGTTRLCRNGQLCPSVGSASTSPILGEVAQNNDIQLNNFASQTLPLR